MPPDEFEMGNVSSPEQERPGIPKTTHDTEVPVLPSPRSSITAREPATTKLRPHFWPIFVFLAYATLVLVPWTFVCIMSKRPIKGQKSYDIEDSSTIDRFAVNERYYRVARIIQPIVGLLIIPVTSAICSMACVAYMQFGSRRKSLTLRQSMALADQAWISPRTLPRLAALGSLPLYVAFALTLFGCVFQILQGALVEPEQILAGITQGMRSEKVPDLTRMIQDSQVNGYGGGGVIVYQLRSLLESTNGHSRDANLWGDFSVTETPSLLGAFNSRRSPYLSARPYVAPLPAHFSSGIYPRPQYMPRLSSSLEYTNPSQDEWERECRNETESGGFYALYEHDGNYDTTVEACMTGNLRISPWRPTRDRQDITETLYLRIRYGNLKEDWIKIEANSTLGYFEVPSQFNNNTPGPILDKDPIPGDSEQFNSWYGQKRQEGQVNSSYPGNLTLMQTDNQGPLMTLTLALFGPGSFVDSGMSNRSSLIVDPAYYTERGAPVGYGNCVGLMPLSFLMAGDSVRTHDGCIKDDDLLSVRDIDQLVREFLDTFLRWGSESARGPLEAALFLANKLWLLELNKYSSRVYSSREGSGGLQVYYVDGFPTIKPKMSTQTLVVCSVLLGLHILGLMVLTLYVWNIQPWMGSLGADVMVRMGAVYADVLRTTEGKKDFKQVVGQLPGFVGDENPAGELGRIRVGAVARLSRRSGRRFEILQ